MREEVVLDYIYGERLYQLLQNKLFIETVLRSTLDNRSSKDLDPVFDTSRSLIGLKLPSALPKDTIKKENKANKAMTPEELAEWKTFLENLNKK